MYKRAYDNMSAKDLDSFRKDIGVLKDLTKEERLKQVKRKMTPEQWKAHQGFVKRHSYSVADLMAQEKRKKV
jgi:hypothetical protein